MISDVLELNEGEIKMIMKEKQVDLSIVGVVPVCVDKTQ